MQGLPEVPSDHYHISPCAPTHSSLCSSLGFLGSVTLVLHILFSWPELLIIPCICDDMLLVLMLNCFSYRVHSTLHCPHPCTLCVAVISLLHMTETLQGARGCFSIIVPAYNCTSVKQMFLK